MFYGTLVKWLKIMIGDFPTLLRQISKNWNLARSETRSSEKEVTASNLTFYNKTTANDIQIGGEHYKRFKGFEPWDVITAWELGYLDGTALKYIARWKHKNGIEDLKKAIHFLQKCVEVEEAKL